MNHLPLTISRNSHIPIYVQIKDGIARLIQNGTLNSGDMIPSENDLSRLFDISPMTVRQAMGELVSDGLIYRERGKGTFVSKRRLQHQSDTLVSFSEDMLSRGMQPSSRILTIELSPPPQAITDYVDIAPNTPFTRIKRLRLADGVPVGVHDSYLNDIEITLNELKAASSLYSLLESKQIFLDTGTETIEATSAKPKTAKLLRVNSGAPLLKAQRYVWDANGQFIEYVIALYHADLYRYTSNLKR